MELTAKQIADFLKGTVEGNPDTKVQTFARIEEGKEGSRVFFANVKYESYIYNTKASIILLGRNFELKSQITNTIIRVEDPYTAIARLLDYYKKIKRGKPGIAKSAIVAKSAKIGKNSFIGEHTVIGENTIIGENCYIYHNISIHENVSIGNDCIFYSGVVIKEDCKIGNRCILQPNAVIGSDGFGFAPQPDGTYFKIQQTGNVILEDDVEIGANTTIDRATMGSTIIHTGVKLDNLIQIAHNCEIGEHSVIAAQTGISGSTSIGKNAMIGGQVGLSGHLKMGNNIKIAAQAGVIATLKDNEQHVGSPSMDIKHFFQSYVHFKNLGKLVKRIDQLEKELKSLKEKAE